MSEDGAQIFDDLLEASIRPSNRSTKCAPGSYRDANKYENKCPLSIRVLANCDEIASPNERMAAFLVNNEDLPKAKVDEFQEAFELCKYESRFIGSYEENHQFETSAIRRCLEQLINPNMLYMYPEHILDHAWDLDCAQLVVDVIQVMEVGHYIVRSVHLHCCHGLRIFTCKEDPTDSIEKTVAGSIVHLLNHVFNRDMVLYAHSVLISLDGNRTIDGSGQEWNADDNDDTIMLYSRRSEPLFHVSLVAKLQDEGLKSYLRYGEPFYTNSDKPSPRDMMNYYKLLEAWKVNKLQSRQETRETVEESIRLAFADFSRIGYSALAEEQRLSAFLSLIGYSALAEEQRLSLYELCLWMVVDLADKEQLTKDYDGVLANLESLTQYNSWAITIVGYHICMLLKHDPEVELADVMSILPTVMFLKDMASPGGRRNKEGDRWKFLARALDVEDREQLSMEEIQNEIIAKYQQCVIPHDLVAESKSTHLGPPGLARALILDIEVKCLKRVGVIYRRQDLEANLLENYIDLKLDGDAIGKLKMTDGGVVFKKNKMLDIILRKLPATKSLEVDVPVIGVKVTWTRFEESKATNCDYHIERSLHGSYGPEAALWCIVNIAHGKIKVRNSWEDGNVPSYLNGSLLECGGSIVVPRYLPGYIVSRFAMITDGSNVFWNVPWLHQLLRIVKGTTTVTVCCKLAEIEKGVVYKKCVLLTSKYLE